MRSHHSWEISFSGTDSSSTRPLNLPEIFKKEAGMHKCSRCQVWFALSRFPKDASQKSGHRGVCKPCHVAMQREYRSREPYRSKYLRQMKVARQRPLGIARRLRNRYGFSQAAAAMLAVLIADPYARCSICGLPARVLKAMVKRNLPLPKNQYGDTVAVLTVDHIVPGGPSELGNVRLLCSLCNSTRGPAILTDEEVLRRARNFWIKLLGNARTWWLNTEPGIGGRSVRRTAREP